MIDLYFYLGGSEIEDVDSYGEYFYYKPANIIPTIGSVVFLPASATDYLKLNREVSLKFQVIKVTVSFLNIREKVYCKLVQVG
jgi:hypothetical protein